MKSELESAMSAQNAETTEIVSNTMSFSAESPSTSPPDTTPPQITVPQSSDFTENLTDVITEATTAAANNKDAIYVITPTGKKYHRPTCRLVKTIKQYVTKEEAEAMGYTPCKICKPT